MVGQHDAARAHANRLRSTGDMTHQHSRSRAGNAGHVVMLSQPVTGKAQFFGMLRCAHSNFQRISHGAAFAYGDQVQHGQIDVVQRFHGDEFFMILIAACA